MLPFLRIDRAARTVLAGGVVAYPTEAVYGLGCLPFDRDAVERILAIKGRDAQKGFILVAADAEQVQRLAELPSGARRREILASWPGPVTWLLRARDGVPGWLTGGRETIAMRVTGHEIAHALCRRVGEAVVSTSANRSGRPPLRTALGVRRALGSQVDYVLAGPLGGEARPTVIRDAETGRVVRG